MRYGATLVLGVTLLFGLVSGKPAHAQNLIERPKAHSDYDLELEAHLAFLLRNAAPGFGARITWELIDPGFIKGLNNTVGVGVGIDLGINEFCEGVGESQTCTQGDLDLVIPATLQWNFWFTPEWSAYFEPGVAFARRRYGPVFAPHAAVGGRYQLARDVLLTLRLGYPAMTFGASYLF